MARRVLVLARTLSDVGDRSLATMRVVGETLNNRIYIRQRGDFKGERDRSYRANALHPCRYGSGRA